MSNRECPEDAFVGGSAGSGPSRRYPTRKGVSLPPAFWTAIAAAAGAALGIALLVHYGLGEIFALLLRSGFAIVALVGIHCLQLWLTATAWKGVFPHGAAAPGRISLMRVRWIREGVNNLLPLTNIGGIVIGIRLLCRDGMRGTAATAATVVDMSLELAAQLAFTLLGLAVLARSLDPKAAAAPILIGVTVLAAMAAALGGAQWLGLARFPERLAKRFGFGGRMNDLHKTIFGIYRMRRGLAGCAGFHLVAWLFGSFEVWVGLSSLRSHASLAQALVIESLSQMLRTTSFAIPGALGVQEGGLVLLCGLFGIPPETALALSLLKRLREVVLGAPSIAVWLRHERQGRPQPESHHAGVRSPFP
jgi:putative membrane protein